MDEAKAAVSSSLPGSQTPLFLLPQPLGWGLFNSRAATPVGSDQGSSPSPVLTHKQGCQSLS